MILLMEEQVIYLSLYAGLSCSTNNLLKYLLTFYFYYLSIISWNFLLATNIFWTFEGGYLVYSIPNTNQEYQKRNLIVHF